MAEGRVLLLQQNVSGEHLTFGHKQFVDEMFTVDSIAQTLESAGVVSGVDVFKVGACHRCVPVPVCSLIFTALNACCWLVGM